MEPEEIIAKICLGLKDKDRFLIISDIENREFGLKIYKVGNEICETAYIELEGISKRPIRDYPEKLKEFIEEFKPTASCYLATCKEGEIGFRIKLIKHLTKVGSRHAHMPGLNKRIWEMGLRADYRKIEEITLKVFEKVKNSKEIEVYSEGTELFVKGFYNWIPDTGIFREPGKFGNLPAGEVFTCPKRIEGKFSAFLIGDYFVKYGKLKNPIILEIESSEIVEIRGRNEKLVKELENYIFEGPKNSTRIGEFAIGTNIFLKELIGNMLQDEKFPGVHIAAGDPYPEETGAPWSCEVHVDFLTLKPDVVVDGEKIMEKGKFLSI